MEQQKITLSPEEIQHLFKFVKSKYVHFIDVQYEIVDHLASAIEELQEKDPSLSFQKALQEVYSRFPITGFAKFVQSKSSAMTKFWRRRLFQYILGYFTLPKVILTLGLSYFYFILQYYYQFTGWFTSFDLMLIPSFLVFAFYCIQAFPERKKSMKYLILNSYYAIMGAMIWIPVYLIGTIGDQFVSVGLYMSIVLSIIYAVLNILWYGTLFVFPKILKEEIAKNYSHLQLA